MLLISLEKANFSFCSDSHFCSLSPYQARFFLTSDLFWLFHQAIRWYLNVPWNKRLSLYCFVFWSSTRRSYPPNISHLRLTTDQCSINQFLRESSPITDYFCLLTHRKISWPEFLHFLFDKTPLSFSCSVELLHKNIIMPGQLQRISLTTSSYYSPLTSIPNSFNCTSST